ncbi:MAG: transporter [Sphingomonadales bacterium]
MKIKKPVKNSVAYFLTKGFFIFLLFGLMSPLDAEASEGADSSYFPGAYGDFAVAIAPEPGFTLVNYTLFYDGQVNQAILQGQVNLNLDTFAVIDMVGSLYTFKKPVLGARFAMGAFVPFGYAHLKTTIATQMGNFFAKDTSFNIGDTILIPASFYWHQGKVHIKFYEMIFAPTGKYDVNDVVNIGRNYWSFDTVLAITWMDPAKGLEISVVTGVMANAQNKSTKYKTGTELHIDFMVNRFLSATFAIGLKGYYYTQISGDSGTGAILGSFKGSSVGIGPSLMWVPKFGKGKLTVMASWIHDLSATRRFKSDYAIINIVRPF